MKRPASLDQSLNDVKYEQYVNNLHDRLPQLVDPNDIDCQRWPWELVQNAKDTVVKRENPEDRFVDIVIKYYIDDNDQRMLYFEHNGDQFTNKAITGLIWKFSAEKRNEQTTEDGLTRDKQSTGRFGTGFMTTHALSLTVDVSGSIFHDDPEIMRNVSVDFTLHREGPDDDAYKRGVDLTEQEIGENMGKRPILDGEYSPTRFTYHLNKEYSSRAAEMGIDNVRGNGAQTMLFCPSVRSITVIDEIRNSSFKITRRNNDFRKNVIKESSFIEESSDSNVPIIRRFISYEIEEYSDPISSHWKTKDRNLRLHVAIEVDDKNNILAIPPTSPSVYCSLPLIGYKEMTLPFYINSNDFEPETERTSLYLKKKEYEKRTNEETDEEEVFYLQSGINWSILKRSVSIYEIIVNYLIENNYNQRYNLIKGLGSILKGSWKDETKNCLASRFILPLRTMLTSKNLVKTTNGYRSINSDVKFVECSDDCDLHVFYDICRGIYGSNLPIEDENQQWILFKWGRFKFEQDFSEKVSDNENPSFPIIKYDKIAEIIEKSENIDNLKLDSAVINEYSHQLTSEQNLPIRFFKLEWLNKFYEWIKNSKIKNLSDKKIVPNRLGVFCSTEPGSELKDASDIPTHIFDFMKSIGINWDEKLMMDGVQNISLPKETHENIVTAVKDRSKEIRDAADSDEGKLTRLLPILLALPSNENNRTGDFLLKRKHIVSILRVIFPSEYEKMDSYVLDLKAELWEDTDKWFMKIVAQNIANRKHLDIIDDEDDEIAIKSKYCTAEWLSETLNFMFQKSYLHQEDITVNDDKKETLLLIPNRYGDFCAINELRLQGQIPEELLDEKLVKCGYDVKRELLYKGFTLNEKISIKDLTLAEVATKYNEFFESEEDTNKELVANYLMHLIPECGDQFREIHVLYDEFNNVEAVEAPSKTISTSDLKIWEGAKEYVIQYLSKQVSEIGDLFTLGTHLLGENSDSKNEHSHVIGLSWLNRLAKVYKQYNIICEDLRLIPDWNGEFHTKDEIIYNGNKLYDYKDIGYIIKIAQSNLWKHCNDESISDSGNDKILSKIVHPKYVYACDFQDNTDAKLFVIIDKLIEECSKKNDPLYRPILRTNLDFLLKFFESNNYLSEATWSGLFNYSFPQRKALYYDFICDSEMKARIAKITDSFSADEIDNLISDKETIKEIIQNKDYYLRLEDENARLKRELEELKFGRVMKVRYTEDDLSDHKQFEAQIEAQQKLIELRPDWGFPENYGEWNGDKPYHFSTVSVINEKEEEMPIVLKSYKYKANPFFVGVKEWEWISNGAKLFVYSHYEDGLGIREIKRDELIKKQSNFSITFESENLDIDEYAQRVSDFAEVLHYFKGLHFNFDSFTISPTAKRVQDIHAITSGTQSQITDDEGL